ncbi:DUF3078 domain-containing protein [Deminuibacter soli]|uniref:DUF3078 domain-containing protein n=2 Tax=Deminuibacter soli TaxID=2291815 RepID=A0A3E1NKL0_9BACT|nr:DUF3078 domain-containing protein [Deminuibacter soli]
MLFRLRTVLLLGATLLFGATVFAQDDIPVRTLPNEIFRDVKKDPKDTIKWSWKRGGLFNLNLAQGSLSNWAAGGDNFSLALTTYVNYFMLYQRGRHTWDNNLDFNFGFVKTSSLGSRKNDDRLDFLSKYGYSIDTSRKLFISGLFNFRTQFFDGYNYDGGTGVRTSSLLSPAYVLLSLGLDYKPVKEFSIFVSPITSRFVIVTSSSIAGKGLYGVDTGKHIATEFGAFASLNYGKEIMKNVVYKGRMDLFSNYVHKPLNIDLYMTNMLTFKINKFLSATYELDAIYDDDVRLFGPGKQSAALQLKSMIGIGLSRPLTTIKRLPDQWY